MGHGEYSRITANARRYGLLILHIHAGNLQLACNFNLPMKTSLQMQANAGACIMRGERLCLPFWRSPGASMRLLHQSRMPVGSRLQNQPQLPRHRVGAGLRPCHSWVTRHQCTPSNGGLVAALLSLVQGHRLQPPRAQVLLGLYPTQPIKPGFGI
jgi:hypothetical protein